VIARTLRPTDIGDILRFLAEAGADEALDDVAPNRFLENSRRVSSLPGQASPKPSEENAAASATSRETAILASPEAGREPTGSAFRPPAAAAVPDEAQAALARQAARQAQSLDELHQTMAAFDGCNLKFTAKNLVFADGNPNSELMLVGEAPGRDEDLEGLPFVGRSGQLLDRMLAAIGRDRQSAYIANVIPWRPPGNRTPTPHETEICRPFIERQIELANPKVLVTLGGPAAKLLLDAQEGVLRLRGNWRTHVTSSGASIPTMPTLHPAYLLRNPAHKKLAWRDFLEVKAKLRGLL
jgi:uracil-DNA glycosylase family 4